MRPRSIITCEGIQRGRVESAHKTNQGVDSVGGALLRSAEGRAGAFQGYERRTRPPPDRLERQHRIAVFTAAVGLLYASQDYNTRL